MVRVKDSLHHQTPMEKHHDYSCLGTKEKIPKPDIWDEGLAGLITET